MGVAEGLEQGGWGMGCLWAWGPEGGWGLGGAGAWGDGMDVYSDIQTDGQTDGRKEGNSPSVLRVRCPKGP